MKKKILTTVIFAMILVSSNLLADLGWPTFRYEPATFWIDANGQEQYMYTVFYQFGTITYFSDGTKFIWRYGQENLPGGPNWGIIGDSTDIEILVFPNPSNLDSDISIRIDAKSDLMMELMAEAEETGEEISGEIEIYHLYNGEVIYRGSMDAIVGETYTICRELLNNRGIYVIVGNFNYLENSIKTYSLIMRVEQ